MKRGLLADGTDATNPVLVHYFVVVPDWLCLRIIELEGDFRIGTGQARRGGDGVMPANATCIGVAGSAGRGRDGSAGLRRHGRKERRDEEEEEETDGNLRAAVQSLADAALHAPAVLRRLRSLPTSRSPTLSQPTDIARSAIRNRFSWRWRKGCRGGFASALTRTSCTFPGQ